MRLWDLHSLPTSHGRFSTPEAACDVATWASCWPGVLGGVRQHSLSLTDSVPRYRSFPCPYLQPLRAFPQSRRAPDRPRDDAGRAVPPRL